VSDRIKRGHQRDRDGHGQRREHLALQAGETEQRQQHQDYDQHPGDHRAGNLLGGAVHHVQAAGAGRGLTELGMDVLDHHHGRVHQDADRDRQAAERHEVGRLAGEPHDQEGGEHRQRQDQRHGQCRAQVTEHHDQHQHHQHHRLAERLLDCAHRRRDQFAAVVEGHQFDALRQARRELGDGALHALDRRAAVAALAQQHQPGDRFARAVGGHRPVAGECAEAHLGQVADVYRCAVAGRDRHGADAVGVAQLTEGAHQQDLLVAIDAVAAGIAVVLLERLFQVIEIEPVGAQRLGARDDLERAHLAAQRIDVGHAGHGAQPRTDHPVLQRAQLGVAVAGTGDAVHVGLAERGGDRRQHRLGPGRQAGAHLVEALGHLRARPVDVGAVLEIDDDAGERVLGGRAQHRLARQALQLHLDREGDARFDLGRCQPRGLDHHHDLRAGDVREGIDRQAAERPQPAERERGGHDQQHQALHQRETYQRGDHGVTSAASSDSPAASRSSAASSHCWVSSSR
jgi:hypothetical protein